MKRKNYQAPELSSYEETGECQLLVGTTIPVIPGEEVARVKLRASRPILKKPTRPCAHSSITRWTICLVLSKIFGERNNHCFDN